MQEVHEVVGGVQVGAGQRAAAEQRGDLGGGSVAALLRLHEPDVPAHAVTQGCCRAGCVGAHIALVRRGSGSCTSHILSAVATTWLSVHSDCGEEREKGLQLQLQTRREAAEVGMSWCESA